MMARIDMIQSGFLYSTDFSILDPVWILSPNDKSCIDITESGGLLLRPSNFSGSVLALHSDSRLGQYYVIEAEISYIPLTINDSAGITLWSSEGDAIYLSIVAGGRVYEKLRLKVFGERCEAYAKSAGSNSWEIIGTAFVSKDPLPGVYAEGQADALVTNLVMVRDTKISIGNVPTGHIVTVYDELGSEICSSASSNGGCVLQLTNDLVLRGRLSVKSGAGDVIAITDIIDISGGSVFWLNTGDLALYIDGSPVGIGESISLGGLINGTITKKLDIYNPTEADINGVKVMADCFNITAGSDWVRFAPDVNGIPGYYDKELYIPQVPAGQHVSCWLKVEKPAQALYYPYTEHSFAIVIKTES